MNMEAYKKRMEWYGQARFGMFIHWGLYAIPARGEWVRSIERISTEDYQKYFDAFDPQCYEPRQWAKLAKRAGMKYAVLTAKHHDGFCLFDSAYTDYKATNTKAGRDLVREYADAFRAEGLKVGLYYSLLDWHHPDYPHYGDRIHPMRDNEAFKDVAHNFPAYVEYMHNQVRELCTNYGKLDLLWFDFSYDDMTGEKWEAAKLMESVRALQPDVIVDNRLEVSGQGFGSLLSGNPSSWSGDFVSPEQIIPPEGIVDVNGEPVYWESCITLNNNWGFCGFDNEWKSAKTVVRKLVECVSKGGNLLLNVGPDAQGRIPEPSAEVLTEVGRWMDKNSESVYGCGPASLEKPPYGYVTQNGKSLYIHVMEDAVGPVPVKGIAREDLVLAQVLASGAELNSEGSWTTGNYPGYLFLSYGETPHFSYALPDETDTVFKLTLTVEKQSCV